ncbi:MAG TPA: tripartite tricarboxylate transporter TctB family protein [Crenalkalicoccus sp.]|nr:tripartite tricarboxylate transporter TctB family protein [Crenalkalicoccus sp.]
MTAGRRARADLAVGLFVLGLGAVALWQAWAIPASPIYAQVGPRAVPYVVGAGLLLLGAALSAVALGGGWSHTLEEVPEARTNWRALGLMAAGLGANLALIGPLGFSLAASVQFVLVAAAFGSRRPLRDLLVALVLTLLVWFGFVEVLGVNIGAGVLEGLVLRALGQEVP